MGNVIMDEESENTHVINELGLPIMCIGTRNLVIAASKRRNPDLGQEQERKHQDLRRLSATPTDVRGAPLGRIQSCRYRRVPRWLQILTKQLKIKSGKGISYQLHRHRNEVWTFIDGEGELVLDDIRSVVSRGDTVTIKKGVKHTVRGYLRLDIHRGTVRRATCGIRCRTFLNGYGTTDRQIQTPDIPNTILYQANIEALKTGTEGQKKKIVLFVGAGINLGSDSSIDISWNGLLNMMLKDALSILSSREKIYD